MIGWKDLSDSFFGIFTVIGLFTVKLVFNSVGMVLLRLKLLLSSI